MYGDYNWDIKIRGEVGKITRNVSNRKKPVLTENLLLLHYIVAFHVRPSPMCAGSEDEVRGAQVQERGGGVQSGRQPRHWAQVQLVIQWHGSQICTKGQCSHPYFR